MEVQPGLVLFENRSAGTVGLVDVEGSINSGVRGDASFFAHLGEGQDVGDGVRVVPHLAKVLDCAHLVGDLLAATVGLQVEWLIHFMNVGQHGSIAKNGHR